MAVAQGYGKTVTSGSVFAYDVADTRNSYKGEPTTNYIWHQNPRIDASYESYMPEAGNGTITQNHPGAIRVYNGNGTDISYYINGGVSDWTNQRHAYWVYDQILKRPVVRMYNENGSWQSKYYNPEIGSLTNIGVSAGTAYVISWLQYVESLDRSAYVGLYSYSNTNGGNNFWDGLQAAYNTQTHTWQRVSAIFTATNNGQLGNYHGGYTYGMSIGSGELRVADIQLEVKTHPTQYSNSLTRSATQGLLPLVGNSTIDLTNVSFDSNAQMTFDGTNDYISTTPFNPNFSAGITMECVAKWTSSPGGSWQRMFDFGNGASVDNVLFCRYSDTDRLWFGVYNGAGTEYALSNSGAILFGQYALYTATADGTNFKIYVNGQLIYSTANSTVPITTSRANNYIGKSNWPDSYFNGDIPIGRIYNRALTAAEVGQNYRHYKTRFNLS